VEGDWKRDEHYEGPVFHELDETLQQAFINYASDLGVNSELVTFLKEMGVKKEQKEYESWLYNVKRFVES